MSRIKIAKGDMIQLSLHGRQASRKSVEDFGVDYTNWTKAVCQNKTDRYVVEKVYYEPDGRVLYVKLGNTERKTFWGRSRKGPLTGYVLKRDWVKMTRRWYD